MTKWRGATLPAVVAVMALIMAPTMASAQGFEDGVLPGDWTLQGLGGVTNSATGIAAPLGSWFAFIETGQTGGAGQGQQPAPPELPNSFMPGVPGVIAGTTNGSILTSNAFSANAGNPLEFYFNFITTDGGGFPDYAWARLLDANAGDAVVDYIFTAQVGPYETYGNVVVPSYQLTAPTATLTPPTASLQCDEVVLNGFTYGPGRYPLNDPNEYCGGSSGWVHSAYNIAANGVYKLEFLVANMNDQQWATAMAIDGVTINDQPLSTIPEPTSVLLLGTGLLGIAAIRRRRRMAGIEDDLG